MWEAIGALLGIAYLVITRIYANKDNPSVQYDKRKQEFTKAVESKDEAAANVLLDDALERNRLSKLGSNLGRQKNDVSSS